MPSSSPCGSEAPCLRSRCRPYPWPRAGGALAIASILLRSWYGSMTRSPRFRRSPAHGAPDPGHPASTPRGCIAGGHAVAAALSAVAIATSTRRASTTPRRWGGYPRCGSAARRAVHHHQGVASRTPRAADFARSVELSLRRSASAYVDLLLVPLAQPGDPSPRTMSPRWGAPRRDRLARHLGVANCQRRGGRRGRSGMCPEPLVNLQAEFHPYLDQRGLTRGACRSRGLAPDRLAAARPQPADRRSGDQRRISPVGDGKSATQIALRWSVKRGIIYDPALVQHHADRREPRRVRLRVER